MAKRQQDSPALSARPSTSRSTRPARGNPRERLEREVGLCHLRRAHLLQEEWRHRRRLLRPGHCPICARSASGSRDRGQENSVDHCHSRPRGAVPVCDPPARRRPGATMSWSGSAGPVSAGRPVAAAHASLLRRVALTTSSGEAIASAFTLTRYWSSRPSLLNRTPIDIGAGSEADQSARRNGRTHLGVSATGVQAPWLWSGRLAVMTCPAG